MQLRVRDTYIINTDTVALVPNYDGECPVKVLEAGKAEPIFVRKTSKSLIDYACRLVLSDIDSRRKMIYERLRYRNKTPIPIDPYSNIYTFPTKSPSNFDCHWLFLSYIYKMMPLSKKGENGKPKTKILFTDGQELVVDVSIYSLQKQYERTLCCKSLFDEIFIKGQYKFKVIAEPHHVNPPYI